MSFVCHSALDAESRLSFRKELDSGLRPAGMTALKVFSGQ